MIVLWERIEHTTYLESCNRNAIFAEASNDINDEKWHPAQQEDTHDNPNGDCSLYLRIGKKSESRYYAFTKTISRKKGNLLCALELVGNH